MLISDLPPISILNPSHLKRERTIYDLRKCLIFSHFAQSQPSFPPSIHPLPPPPPFFTPTSVLHANGECKPPGLEWFGRMPQYLPLLGIQTTPHSHPWACLSPSIPSPNPFFDSNAKNNRQTSPRRRNGMCA